MHVHGRAGEGTKDSGNIRTAAQKSAAASGLFAACGGPIGGAGGLEGGLDLGGLDGGGWGDR